MVVDSKKPHIVLLPSPGMGHVTPMLELAKRLVQHHSCHVTFLHITAMASDAQTHLFHSSNLPQSINVIHLPPLDPSAASSVPASLPFTRLCITVGETLVRSLRSTLSQLQQKPQALITDIFTTQALDTCTELSIPSYILCTTSARFLVFFLFFRDSNQNISGEFFELPSCAPLRTEDLPCNFNADDDWQSYHMRRIPTVSGILVNTYEELEPVALRAIRENSFFKEISMPPVFPIGPLVKEAETEPVHGTGDECLAWLDEQPSGSVVFVALGSGGSLRAEQITELAWGLELSQQRFLWVSRAPMNASGSGISFLKIEQEKEKKKGPEGYLPEGFIERTRGIGLVVDSWAPQAKVLRHSAIGVFLSHCGWNSILESVCINGVPLITWPLYGDQMMNATMVAEELGVAVKPVGAERKGVIGREEVERVVRAAMEGEEGKRIRVRAKDVKESALKALKRDGPSYQALAEVANNWKAM